MRLDQILQGDCRHVLLENIPPKTVDLVFADPPYNLQLQHELWRPNMTKVDAVDDEWDKFDVVRSQNHTDFSTYDSFTREWLSAARVVMKDTATLWVSGTYHNIFRVGAIMQDLGFWILNTITWFKNNAMPNFRGTRLKNDVEFVIWAKKSEKSRYTFNHHEMKQFNDSKQLGSMWAIPVCAGDERLRDDDGRKAHPTQKPEELLKRILIASSKPGDVVLDPFLGSGTTAAVAKKLHRHWIGVERETSYIQAALRRIDAVIPLEANDALLHHNLPKQRVHVRELLKHGYLSAGQELFLDKPACVAVLLENGHIRVNDLTGSIHKLGATLKRVPTCNGWTHWFYRDQNNELLPLDNLREKFRLEVSA